MEKFAKLKYTELETKKISDFDTTFVFENLSRGYANTLGNAVRRTLLSSTNGISSFATKIANVEHEFQTISGVKEDAVQLILNLKNIRFAYNPGSFEEDEVIKVSLYAEDKIVKSSDLTLPLGISIVDEDIDIATVSKTGKLEFELFLRLGRGFKTFEENKELIKKLSSKIESNISSGSIIAIDSDFSPIENVSYKSEELNTQKADIQEKLTLKIKTDGSIKAVDAVALSAHILISHLEIIADTTNLEKGDIFEANKENKAKPLIERIQISTLDLSVRSYNCLRRAGFLTIDQISEITLDDLINIKNLGKKSVDEIIGKLLEFGITLKGEE